MATSQVETVSTSADKAKLGAAIALVIAALAGFYLLGKQGQIAQWGALVVGLAAVTLLMATRARFGRTSGVILASVYLASAVALGTR